MHSNLKQIKPIEKKNKFNFHPPIDDHNTWRGIF